MITVKILLQRNFMHPTRNSLPEKIRIQVSAVLQERLVDSINLELQAKQASWNVKGPCFFSLHGLFNQVSGDAQRYADLIAERIVQMGGTAEGTLGIGNAKTSLPGYPLSITAGKDHVESLTYALAYYGETINKTLLQVGEYKDAVTGDILTEILRDAEKNLRLVEAHGASNF
jgi:starvation-inducible DNA-binding protein